MGNRSTAELLRVHTCAVLRIVSTSRCWAVQEDQGSRILIQSRVEYAGGGPWGPSTTKSASMCFSRVVCSVLYQGTSRGSKTMSLVRIPAYYSTYVHLYYRTLTTYCPSHPPNTSPASDHSSWASFPQPCTHSAPSPLESPLPTYPPSPRTRRHSFHHP